MGLTSNGVLTLKTRRQEVPVSNPGHACRPSRSEFSRGFLRNSRKCGPGPISGQLAINLQQTNRRTNGILFFSHKFA